MDDIKTYNDILTALFFEFFEVRNIDINDIQTAGKIPTAKYNAVWIYIYNNEVSKHDLKIPYVYYNYDYFHMLTGFYISTCYEFNILTGVNGFGLLTNIPNNTLYRLLNNYDIKPIYNTSKKDGNTISDGGSVGENVTDDYISDVRRLFEAYRETAVSKLNDSHIGLVVNANNNKAMGLEYSKQNIVNEYTARKMVSMSDLPRLE